MDNNKAFVGTITNIKPIDGADKIVSAAVTLNNTPVTRVVVGVDMQEGTKVVYFDSNLALNEGTILKDYPDLARYLAKRGRVKVVKLRGVYSDGLCVELDKFTKYDKDAATWPEGHSFNAVCGVDICKKYEPPMKMEGLGNGAKKGRKGKVVSRMIPGQFNFHVDTSQLPRNMHKISAADVISITQKVHGTSAICSNCLVKKPLGIFSRILRFFGVPIVDTEYDYIYSSRSVVKNGQMDTGFYKTDIWTHAGEVFKNKLAQGESVYYEIVGYLPNGGWIQKNYDYGCKPGEHKVYVYRITKTSPDGHVTEYSWPAVKERCEELCVDHVPEYFFGSVSQWCASYAVSEDVAEDAPDIWRNQFLEDLRNRYLERILESNICKKVPDEGVVVRKEVGHIEAYKLKSMAFLKAEIEAYEKDAENLEDSSESGEVENAG